MTDRELMQQALDMLELVTHLTSYDDEVYEAIYAIRARLAQPEPKPVAWLEPEWGEQICLEVGFEHTVTSDHPKDLCWIPLYTAPPQREWQGLTDEEITACIQMGNSGYLDGFVKPLATSRAVEAKLK